MKRKIVKQGNATMTLSLPSAWIKKNELKEGDELEVLEKGKQLELVAGDIKQEKIIEINAEERGSFTKNDLSHLYILGYDEISIRFKDEETLKQIKERVPDCIGYEITDQHENKVIIRSITIAMESEFDNILRKVFLIQKEMNEGIYEALKDSNNDRLKQLREMEGMNNRFTSFLLRLISKFGYKKQNRSNQAYDLIQNLERLSDEYKYLCDSYLENKKSKLSKESSYLLNEINEYYQMFYNYFYTPKKQDLQKLYSTRKILKEKTNVLFKSQKEPIFAHHCISIIEKIHNCVGSYSAIEIVD